MKTIMLILAAIATMSFAMCLDAQGQRLSLPEGQADSRIPLPAQFRVSVEEGIITLRDLMSLRRSSLEMGVGSASLTPFTRFTQSRTIRKAKRHTQQA